MDNLLISSPSLRVNFVFFFKHSTENHRSLDPHMAMAGRSIGTCGQFLRKNLTLSGENIVPPESKKLASKPHDSQYKHSIAHSYI